MDAPSARGRSQGTGCRAGPTSPGSEGVGPHARLVMDGRFDARRGLVRGPRPVGSRAGDPTPVKQKVKLTLRLDGIVADKGVELVIKPGHPGCRFKPITRPIKGDGTIGDIPPIEVEILQRRSRLLVRDHPEGARPAREDGEAEHPARPGGRAPGTHLLCQLEIPERPGPWQGGRDDPEEVRISPPPHQDRDPGRVPRADSP